MNGRETLDSIREINLSYIMLAQRMLREDQLSGCFDLGLSKELADLLSGLTLAQVVKLAASDQLLCFSVSTITPCWPLSRRPRSMRILRRRTQPSCWPVSQQNSSSKHESAPCLRRASPKMHKKFSARSH